MRTLNIRHQPESFYKATEREYDKRRYHQEIPEIESMKTARRKGSTQAASCIVCDGKIVER